MKICYHFCILVNNNGLTNHIESGSVMSKRIKSNDDYNEMIKMISECASLKKEDFVIISLSPL
jgi:hypothetical protein